IQQPHVIVRSHGPDADVLERRERGTAGFIKLELEAARGRIELEGKRAGLVARGVGNFPGADHLLGGVAGRRRLRAGTRGGQRKRNHSKTRASRHGESRCDGGRAHAITPGASRHASPARRRTNVASPAYAEFTRAHGRFCVRGGHGVSATGVSGGLPADKAKRLPTPSWSILSRAGPEAEPRWGNNTT